MGRLSLPEDAGEAGDSVLNTPVAPPAGGPRPDLEAAAAAADPDIFEKFGSFRKSVFF